MKNKDIKSARNYTDKEGVKYRLQVHEEWDKDQGSCQGCAFGNIPHQTKACKDAKPCLLNKYDSQTKQIIIAEPDFIGKHVVWKKVIK